VKFNIKNGSPEKHKSACVVVGVYEDRKLSPAAESIDAASKGHLSTVLGHGDMEGKVGTTLLLHSVPGILATRTLLVGLGPEKSFGPSEYRRVISAAVSQLNKLGGQDAVIFLTDLKVKKYDAQWRARQAVLVCHDATYRFDQLKSKPNGQTVALKKIDFAFTRPADAQLAIDGLTQGSAIAIGSDFTKDLGNLPGNVCTPTYLADQAFAMAKEHAMQVEVLDHDEMAKLGMNTLLSVARGSAEPPKLIVLHHMHGKKNEKPVVLVGKGITFDSGGISLKPGPGMDEMKYDMCGAGSVLGTMKAAALLNLPINLIGVIAAAENMPGSRATKPGDIVTSLAGLTIEILNTDAEGRLVLCDALTYVERFDPACVVDIATLTGACVIALGHIASGLYANDEDLATELLDAGQQSGDRAWQMPLWEEYHDSLKSNFADMANIGGREGGSITAARFLSRFTEKYTWAHLDIAGTAWKSGKDKGATGRPVPMLTHFLMQRAKRSSGRGKTRA
jgi:leucyl aminopeptidase